MTYDDIEILADQEFKPGQTITLQIKNPDGTNPIKLEFRIEKTFWESLSIATVFPQLEYPLNNELTYNVNAIQSIGFGINYFPTNSFVSYDLDLFFLFAKENDSQIIRKIKLLAKNATNYFNFEKVIIYGSYSSGKYTMDSDIDVAFIVNEITNNHFSLSAKLFELVDKIDNRIEPLILNKNNDKSGFIENILNNGIIIVNNQLN